MKLTTTFNLLREHNACESGYKKLAKHLGGVRKYGADTEINILTILESNGLDDALWCLRATSQNDDCTKRLIACDFAESVLHIFESRRPGDNRPREAIEVARRFAKGEATNEERIKARAAVYAAVADANAAYAVVAAAAADAAYAAVAAADADAAYADANAAYAAVAAADAARKAKKEQLTKILKKHLQD